MEWPRCATASGRCSRSQVLVDITIFFSFPVGLSLLCSLKRERFCKVAGSEVTGAVFLPLGRLLLADCLSVWAARMKMTASRRVSWTWNFAFENDGLHHLIRVERRDGGHERLGVGMQRLIEQVCGCSYLHQPAKIPVSYTHLRAHE